MGAVVNFFGAFKRRTKSTSGLTRHADIVDISNALRINFKAATKEGTKTILVDVFEADFRSSDQTILAGYMKEFRKKNYKWKENHTFLAISKSGHLALWFVGETKLNNSVVIDTRKWRIVDGRERWTVDNIQFYARQVGLELVLPSKSTIQEFVNDVA